MLSPFIILLDIDNPLIILIPMSPGTLKGKSAGMKHETDTQTIKCSAGQPHPHSWYLIIITGVLIYRNTALILDLVTLHNTHEGKWLYCKKWAQHHELLKLCR